MSDDGVLTVKLSNETILTLGNVKGADGTDGSNGKDANSGADGVGVKNVTITEGILKIKLTSGMIIDLGNIKGTNGIDGEDGVSVTSSTINTNGELVIKYTKGGFENCIHLKSVIMPDSITEIGQAAFGLCESLTDVTLSIDSIR